MFGNRLKKAAAEKKGPAAVGPKPGTKPAPAAKTPLEQEAEEVF